jgi:hypothetical protein
VAGLVTQEALAHALALEKRAHGMSVNIAVPGAGRHRERGVCPVPLYPKSGTCVLPVTIASAALTRSTAASSSSGMKSA